MCGFTVVAELDASSNDVRLRSSTQSLVNGQPHTLGYMNGHTIGTNGAESIRGDHKAHAQISEAKIAESLKYIESRGPDSKGVWIDPTRNFGEPAQQLFIRWYTN